MANSYFSAKDYGILPNGPDMSGDLQNLFDDPDCSGVILDFPPGSEVLITMGFNAHGKVLQFQAGTIFVGGG